MQIDPINFRNILGTFATGICVIGANPKAEPAFGITINSFASVSLDPPLILWSLQNNSDCFDGFDRVDHFSVNILASDQVNLSEQFSKKDDHLMAEHQFVLGATGTPLLNDVVSHFECKVWARYPGGDHVILVGEVLNMSCDETKSPLLFHKGGYLQLGY